MNKLNYPCNKAPNGLCIDCTNDGPLCDFDECKYMNPEIQQLNGYVKRMNSGKDNNVRNLTDEETAFEAESEPETETDNGWINVKDRLPDENQKCLVYRDIDNDLKITTGIWHSDRKTFDGLRHGTRLENTIAWMPLPEPPKERRQRMKTLILKEKLT